MSSFLWLALGNLAIAFPLGVLAWWSGRKAQRPALTHGLWVLVFLKLVTPPMGHIPLEVWPAVVVEESAPVVVTETVVAPAGPIEPALEYVEVKIAASEGRDLSLPEPVATVIPLAEVAPPTLTHEESIPVGWASIIPSGILLVWLAGSFIFFANLIHRAWRFHVLLRHAPSPPACLQAEVEGLSNCLGVSCPRIVLTPGLITPLLWVGWRAYLVLPRDLLDRLDAEQRTALLVHELAHWRRGDHWIRRLEMLALGLYWWCPPVWWAKTQLQQAEEECCDAWVVTAVPGSARAYALALVETVDFLAGVRAALPPLASGLGPFSSLQRRLTMIFRVGTPRALTATGLCGLSLLAALLLPWSLMPARSISAQEGPPRKKDQPREEKKDAERRPEPKRGEGNAEDLQREVQQLERAIAEALRQIKDLEGRNPGREPGRGDGEKGQKRPEERRPDGPRFGPEGRDNPRPPIGEGRPDLERRVGEVERKLDTIMWQMAELRRLLEGRGPGPRPEGNPPREGKGDVERRPIGPPQGPGARRPGGDGEERLPLPPREGKEDRPPIRNP